MEFSGLGGSMTFTLAGTQFPTANVSSWKARVKRATDEAGAMVAAASANWDEHTQGAPSYMVEVEGLLQGGSASAATLEAELFETDVFATGNLTHGDEGGTSPTIHGFTGTVESWDSVNDKGAGRFSCTIRGNGRLATTTPT